MLRCYCYFIIILHHVHSLNAGLNPIAGFLFICLFLFLFCFVLFFFFFFFFFGGGGGGGVRHFTTYKQLPLRKLRY